MLVCGCWALPLPCLSTGTSVPPGLPRGVPRGAGNAAPRLEYSWSVVGLTLKVISPPDRGLPGATGHCQSAVGGPKAAVWIRAGWAEFSFPTGSGGRLGESRHCSGQGGGKACGLQAAATGPHTPLAEADAPKTQKAADFVLGGGTPPRLPAPWAGLAAGSQWVGRGGATPGSGGLEGGRAAQTPGFPRAWALSAVTGSGAEVRVQVLNYCSAPDNT